MPLNIHYNWAKQSEPPCTADEELRELVHLISTQFGGDTTAYFDYISSKPLDEAEDDLPELTTIRNVLRSAR